MAYKVQVQMMSGEWQDCCKLSAFTGGKWVYPEFETEKAARIAAERAWPDRYPEGSENATFRIVPVVPTIEQIESAAIIYADLIGGAVHLRPADLAFHIDAKFPGMDQETFYAIGLECSAVCDKLRFAALQTIWGN